MRIISSSGKHKTKYHNVDQKQYEFTDKLKKIKRERIPNQKGLF